MNATTVKLLLAKLALILVVSSASAEDLVGTRIDVQGALYSDQMWLFSASTSTRGYDWGWDGYKMFGSSLSPQLFAVEGVENYQIDVVPDLNNTCLGFIAGEDSVYTFTFTHQNLSFGYQHLYLVDSIANKTVDVYADGTKYTFTATNKTIVKRFKIVTSIPSVTIPQTPTVVTDAVANDTTVGSGTTPVPEVSSTSTTGSADQSGDTLTDGISRIKDKNHGSKKLKVYMAHKTIVVENQGKSKGKLSLYNAMSGKLVKNVEFYANGTTTIQTDEPAGTYVLHGSTQNDEVAKTVMIY